MIVVMLLGATSLMAQNPDKGWSFAGEIGAGTELELGGRAQYNFNKYIAAEGVLKYAYDWRNTTLNNEITIQAGVRGFSPKFGPGMKAFAALDFGYGADFESGPGNWNAFAMDMTVGMYLWKGLYAGYGFGGLFHNGHAPHDHTFRVGYNFEF